MSFAISPLQLHSKSFSNGSIPTRHAKAGGNISPPLNWDNVPEGTRSFALICHDPDAPRIADGEYGFVHWVLYNIPLRDDLPENTDIGTAGVNSYGEQGYGGPRPPSGHGLHHYFFVLFALRSEPTLPPNLSARELLMRIEPEVLGMNRLVGTYES